MGIRLRGIAPYNKMAIKFLVVGKLKTTPISKEINANNHHNKMEAFQILGARILGIPLPEVIVPIKTRPNAPMQGVEIVLIVAVVDPAMVEVAIALAAAVILTHVVAVVGANLKIKCNVYA